MPGPRAGLATCTAKAFVSQDYAAAIKWYRRAAGQGLADAQYNLGVMYYKGQGVPQDYAVAARWYRKAAAQGLASALYNLGRIGAVLTLDRV